MVVVVCNTRHTLHTHTQAPLFRVHTLYCWPLACCTPPHTHTHTHSDSVLVRRWRMGNKLSWLRGWGIPRFPPQTYRESKEKLNYDCDRKDIASPSCANQHLIISPLHRHLQRVSFNISIALSLASYTTDMDIPLNCTFAPPAKIFIISNEVFFEGSSSLRCYNAPT